MELFLDSVDFNEIESATKLFALAGVTTTPTFMHKHGITDIDSALVKLSGMVPSMHAEALGETCDEIISEAHRILELPLKTKPVFKIPISNHGVQACRLLINEGHQVNIHLVYTLNQAYLAMTAGATYVCPLAGRLHDEGHDAMMMIEQVVKTAEKYKYPTKVMVSSVRHPEHVRQSLLIGAHACTVPWSVMKRLSENSLTTLGANEFLEHTRLMTLKVKEVIRKENPVCSLNETLMDAMVKMTESGLGAVSVVNQNNALVGIFTDGDLRRKLKEHGQEILRYRMSDFEYHPPVTISAGSPLYEAVKLFSSYKIDNVIAMEDNFPVGILDIQDLLKMGLVG